MISKNIRLRRCMFSPQVTYFWTSRLAHSTFFGWLFATVLWYKINNRIRRYFFPTWLEFPVGHVHLMCINRKRNSGGYKDINQGHEILTICLWMAFLWDTGAICVALHIPLPFDLKISFHSFPDPSNLKCGL